ncbi:hypothetical protein HZH66_006553 [Vespula vulgaris]|uniref:Uncharacterized protein n=1 Tax=Vespula vulgaris TaxID=7454 RepID=A0A834K7B1_VESVU|nr:hypothetical protein HZH66_006553 [Vespula vulgaris]
MVTSNDLPKLKSDENRTIDFEFNHELRKSRFAEHRRPRTGWIAEFESLRPMGRHLASPRVRGARAILSAPARSTLKI